MSYYAPEVVEPRPVPIVQHVVVVSENMVDSNGLVIGAWSTQLHDSFFENCVPNTCLSFCCPCVSAANIVKRLGWYSYQKVFWGILIVNVILVILSALSDDTSKHNDGSDDNVHMSDDVMYDKSSYRHDNKPHGFPLLTFFGWIISLIVTVFLWQLRMRIRTMFKIPGNAACDFVTVLCCQCCVLAQMASHVSSYTPGNCDFRAPETLPGYNFTDGGEAMEAGQMPKTEENDGIVLGGNWTTASAPTSA